MKVGFVSLGCSKNLVDTEMVIGLFKNHKFEIVNDAKQAEIIIINTCGFIESAKQEAIDTILEMSEYKNNKCKYLIVMGCLVQRYKKELEKALLEVDLFVSISEYGELWDLIERLIAKKHNDSTNKLLDYFDRVITTGETTAYLKIAEGCSNNCTYCAIPRIRGPQISRKMEDIIIEAEMLANKGIQELIVIAQDTTKYGLDIYGELKLAELLEKLDKIKGVKWIRFLYSYPETITDELINVVKNSKKICKYFDMPIQHISNTVLKRMNRKTDKDKIVNTINKIRKEIPEAILRTSLIVGFPGETKEDFDLIYEFVKQIKFDRLGVFKYSKEDGTPASKLKEQIHPSTKKSRYNKIMKLQNEIVKEKLSHYIGTELEILIEGVTTDNKYYIARSSMDIPDNDGVIYVKKSKTEIKEKFVKCKIIDVKEYDLIGTI